MVNDWTSRIRRIMEEENMNATQFSEAIGIQRAAMSHILKGRNNPSLDVISKISERFETINPGWLMNGKGPMRTHAQDAMYQVAPTHDAYERSANQWDETEIDFTEDAAQFDESAFAGGGGYAGRSAGSGERAGGEVRERPQTLFDQLEGAQVAGASSQGSSGTQIRAGEAVKPNDRNTESAGNEVIIYKERQAKTIDKILIFYSDHTYETFVRSEGVKG